MTTYQPNDNNVSVLLSLNTASLALFRVLSAVAILWHLMAHQGLLVTLILLLPVLALALGYRTQLMASGLLAASLLLIVLNWQTLSIHDAWMAMASCWCLCLPVNAQWGVDAALQHPLKENPNATQEIMPRTYRVSSVLAKVVVTLVLATFVLALFAHSIALSVFNLAALSMLVPKTLWQTLFTTLKASPQYQNIQQLIMHYDADCGFCLKMCLVLREFLLTRDTHIITAQSNEKIFAIMEANNSWVIQSSNGDTHIHWHAMQHLFAQRQPFKPIAWVMNLAPLMRIGNAIYGWVAVNRDIMGRITAKVLPWTTITQTPKQLTIIGAAALSMALALLQLKVAVL